MSYEAGPGIRCPFCRAVLNGVVDSRPRANRVVRVRRCAKCGKRCRTAETVIPGVPRERTAAPPAN